MNRENNRNFLEGKKYNIITFGCQMNEHDSETIAGMLEEEGCRQVLTKEESDITIINTCSIRENADKRFFGTLGQLKKIKEKTGAKEGERTVLDALCPAVTVLNEKIAEPKSALIAAAQAAAEGAEATKQMIPVHGRAAYYGEKSLGHYDGGAVAGKLIFEALAQN